MSARVIVISVFVLWISSWFIVAGWSEIMVGEICDKNEYTGEKECAQYGPLLFSVIKVFKTLDHHEGSVIGLATLALAFFTWRLWWSTERLVIGAEDTAQRQLRAYVHTLGAGIGDESVPNIKVGTRFHIAVRIKNFGQTPAHDVVHWMAYGVDKYPTRASSPTRRMDIQIPATVIAPGSGTDNTQLMPPLTAVQVAGLMDGTMAVYVIGEVTYKDVFGKCWYTKYELMHDRGSGFVDGEGTLRACEYGNEAT